MAEVIELDFAAHEPQLTHEAQAAFDRWRVPLDDLLYGSRKAGDWAWAGELTYRINAVRRMCRKLSQPVSHEHMRIVLDALSETVPTADLDVAKLIATAAERV
ncbi:hypothetical protein [Pseudodonghicola xiamenensis]|uniref:Uncharacterized protein n=1 Tax=Pseudodonghicola xiamenensis TaxID=337702 RepID=A0A8J3MEB2_9RHOB|nr:hypothetical protein [Pseudodonghicola xiamenensis]GHH02112.1 hypothetical protein GCM10010961_39810 [Pseudodonghicola xiamenensis]